MPIATISFDMARLGYYDKQKPKSRGNIWTLQIPSHKKDSEFMIIEIPKENIHTKIQNEKDYHYCNKCNTQNPITKKECQNCGFDKFYLVSF